jgi:hypothetical protein
MQPGVHNIKPRVHYSHSKQVFWNRMTDFPAKAQHVMPGSDSRLSAVVQTKPRMPE